MRTRTREIERRGAGVAAAALLFGIAPARPAAAEVPRSVPAPFVLPDLSHPGIDARVDQLFGRLTSTLPSRSASIGGMIVPSVETSPFAARTLYLGLSYAVAAALPPDRGLPVGAPLTPSGARTLFGNTEAYLRAVFPLPRSMPAAAALLEPRRTALEIGFLLSVVAPTATFDRSSRGDRSAAEAAASFDPMSYAHFLPHRVVLRSAGDLRIVRGPLVFHGRHGLDAIIDVDGVESVSLAGRLVGHIGYLARPDLELSVEAQEVYFFARSEREERPLGAVLTPEAAFDERYRISDARRAAWTIGPGLRWAVRGVDLGAAIVTNAGEPLSPAANSFVALRLSLIAHARAFGDR